MIDCSEITAASEAKLPLSHTVDGSFFLRPHLVLAQEYVSLIGANLPQPLAGLFVEGRRCPQVRVVRDQQTLVQLLKVPFVDERRDNHTKRKSNHRNIQQRKREAYSSTEKEGLTDNRTSRCDAWD